MRILFIIPPYVPSYFNAGHHLPLFQTAAYIREMEEVDEVVCLDAAALNSTWKEICDLLIQRFDLIVLMNDFDGIDTFKRFTYYSRRLCPNSKIITFGRLSHYIPGFFTRYNFEAIVESGDYETGIAEYINHLHDPEYLPKGILLKSASSYESNGLGLRLDAEDWILPEVEEIPYNAYDQMYLEDLNKFCGIPKRRELVLQVARGCPVGCSYCDVPGIQGKRERRLPVSKTISYIQEAFLHHPFEYVSFYAPTFTLNKKWVTELCEELEVLGSPYPWKCVTTMYHLNEELISKMAKAGCVRISIGLETLTQKAFEALPKIKRDTKAKYIQLTKICKAHGIELNCFVILGLPGDHPKDVKYTIELIESLGGRVRPTIYTPYEELSNDMSEEEVMAFNRQIFLDGLTNKENMEAYYSLFFNRENDKPTKVMENIPFRMS